MSPASPIPAARRTVQHEPILSDFANDSAMRGLVALFVDELADRARAIQRLAENRDLDLLRRMAHQLKGACGGYGFPSVGAAAGTLEGTLDEALAADHPADRLPVIQSQVNALLDLCQRVRAR